MKQSIRIGALLIASAFSLCACQSNDSSTNSDSNIETVQSSHDDSEPSQGGYVDIDDEKNKIENFPTVLDVQFDGYTAHQKSWSLSQSEYSLDENYLYLWNGAYHMGTYGGSGGALKFNLKTGRIENLCETAGCTHNEDLSPDCANFVKHSYDTMAKGGLYNVIGDTLFLVTGDLSGNEKTAIWTNTFSTDYCRECAPEYNNGFNFIVKGEVLHLFCYNWYYSVNLQTMEQTEPIVISDSQIFTLDVCGDYLWYTTDAMELFCWQLSSGEKKKIADKSWRVTCVGDQVYYLSEDNITMTRCNPDGSEPQVLLEGISVCFYITEKSIYYTNAMQSPTPGAFRCDLDGKNAQEIKLELNYTPTRSYQMSELYMAQFVSDPTCNYIFLVDRSNTESALFAIPKDTTEAVGFSLYS